MVVVVLSPSQLRVQGLNMLQYVVTDGRNKSGTSSAHFQSVKRHVSECLLNVSMRSGASFLNIYRFTFH